MKNLSLFLLLFVGFYLNGQSLDYGVVEKIDYTLFDSQATDDGGKVFLKTTKPSKKRKNDIVLTKVDAFGNEIWRKTYGGTAYDRGSSIQKTKEGGYIIIGSTSSKGKGNNDVWLIKTDADGQEEWNQTFGGFYNEYGLSVDETPDGGYLVRGKKQVCQAHNDWENCYDYIWFIKTDVNGQKVWSN